MKEGVIAAGSSVSYGVRLDRMFDPGEGFGRRRRLGIKGEIKRPPSKPKTAWQLRRAARKASTNDWLEL